MNNHRHNGHSFRDLVETHYSRLGRQRQRVVKYVNDHLQTAVFLTAGQLAKHVGTDAGTVVRTAQDLGYRGYGEFIEGARQCLFESRSAPDSTPYEIVRRSVRDDADPEHSIVTSLEEERHNLQHLSETIKPKQLVKLARRITRARQTLVIGIDLAGTLARHLEYALLPLGLPVRAVSAGGGYLRNHLTTVDRRDLIIAITFRRGLRETVAAAKEARAAGAHTVGLTDSRLSPLVKVCDEVLIAPIATQSYAGSYVAPLALINALFVALTKCNPANSLRALGKLNKEYESGNRWC